MLVSAFMISRVARNQTGIGHPGPVVLVQREMEKRRSPLVSIPPFGRGFSRHEGLSSDDLRASGCNAGEAPPAPLSIGSMSPPDYPSAWLRPRSARFRFARQDHCSPATTCRFSTAILITSVKSNTCHTEGQRSTTETQRSSRWLTL